MREASKLAAKLALRPALGQLHIHQLQQKPLRLDARHLATPRQLSQNSNTGVPCRYISDVSIYQMQLAFNAMI